MGFTMMSFPDSCIGWRSYVVSIRSDHGWMDISVRGDDECRRRVSLAIKVFRNEIMVIYFEASCSSAHDGKQSRNCCIVALTIKLWSRKRNGCYLSPFAESEQCALPSRWTAAAWLAIYGTFMFTFHFPTSTFNCSPNVTFVLRLLALCHRISFRLLLN